MIVRAHIVYRTPKKVAFTKDPELVGNLLVVLPDYYGLKMWFKKRFVLNYDQLEFYNSYKIQELEIESIYVEAIETFKNQHLRKLLKYEK